MVLARTIREKQDLGCIQDICNHIIQENILNDKWILSFACLIRPDYVLMELNSYVNSSL